MKFRTWLEAINVPPHMPLRFFKEAKKAVDDLDSLIKQVLPVSDELYKRVKEFAYSQTRNAISDMLDQVGSISRYVDLVKNALDYILTYHERGKSDPYEMRKYISRVINNDLSERVESMDVDTYATAVLNLYDEIESSKSDWNDEWYGSYESMIDGINLLKNTSDALKRLKSWYPKLQNYIKAFVSMIDRELEIYMSGKKTLPDHESVEKLYHATSAMSAILRDGFKTRAELQTHALGGGPSDLISFTSDVRVAEAIVWALRRAVEIAQGKIGYKQVELLSKHVGADFQRVLNHVKSARGGDQNTVNREVPDSSNPFGFSRRDVPRTEVEKREWLFQAFTTLLAFQDKRYNPLFYGVDVETLAKINPKDIGVLAAEVDMTQVKDYLSSMEEYRVPTGAIKRVWRVPYKGETRPYI